MILGIGYTRFTVFKNDWEDFEKAIGDKDIGKVYQSGTLLAGLQFKDQSATVRFRKLEPVSGNSYSETEGTIYDIGLAIGTSTTF